MSDEGTSPSSHREVAEHRWELRSDFGAGCVPGPPGAAYTRCQAPLGSAHLAAGLLFFSSPLSRPSLRFRSVSRANNQDLPPGWEPRPLSLRNEHQAEVLLCLVCLLWAFPTPQGQLLTAYRGCARSQAGVGFSPGDLATVPQGEAWATCLEEGSGPLPSWSCRQSRHHLHEAVPADGGAHPRRGEHRLDQDRAQCQFPQVAQRCVFGAPPSQA